MWGRRDDAEATTPTLQQLERRRWHLWIVAGVLLLAASTAVALLVAEPEVAADLLAHPGLRWGFLGVSAAFVIYVFEQERSFRRVTRGLVAEHRHATTLEDRVRDLTTLNRAARAVNSVLAPREVFRVLLESSLELTGASTGTVLLYVRDQLTVAASDGATAPERGTAVAADAGLVGRSLGAGRPEVGEVPPGGSEPGLTGSVAGGGSAVCAPLVVDERTVGVLALLRPAVEEPFGPADLELVALFAEQAATAVANASRYERERGTVQELVDAERKRSEFVATMVHDLRSPLQAMMGYGELLRDRGERLTPAQRAQAVDAVLEQGERLQRMIGEVLGAASTEAGKELRREPVDLGRLLSEARQLVGAVSGAERDDRPVRLFGLSDTVLVDGDAEALRHVLTNLVENAVKYSPPGSPIDVQLERGGTEVVVRVTDHGPGIPEDEIGEVFERFRRAERTKSGGVGLGLYIVRTLVQAHGGRVWVTSTPGEGTTFHVALPVPAGDPAPA